MGGSDIRSMSSIRPICKCRCPHLSSMFLAQSFHLPVHIHCKKNLIFFKKVVVNFQLQACKNLLVILESFFHSPKLFFYVSREESPSILGRGPFSMRRNVILQQLALTAKPMEKSRLGSGKKISPCMRPPLPALDSVDQSPFWSAE